MEYDLFSAWDCRKWCPEQQELASLPRKTFSPYCHLSFCWPTLSPQGYSSTHSQALNEEFSIFANGKFEALEMPQIPAEGTELIVKCSLAWTLDMEDPYQHFIILTVSPLRVIKSPRSNRFFRGYLNSHWLGGSLV